MGNVLTVTNPRRDTACPTGCVATYTYTALNDIASVNDGRSDSACPTGCATTYTYESQSLSCTTPAGNHGNLCSITDGAGNTTQLRYDNAATPGMLTKITDPLGQNTQFAYDTYGNRTTVQDDVGNTVTYGYDIGSRVTSVIDAMTPSRTTRMKTVTPNWIGGGYTQYTYDGAGRLYQATLPATTNTVSTYGYDTANRLTGITNTQGLTTISSHSYVPNPNGNRDSATDNDGVTASTTGFSYDVLDRLSAVGYQNPTSNVTYQYDGVGNRTTLTVDGTPTTYTYDASDGLATINGVSTTSDKNGNLRLIDTNNAFNYDAENRLFRTGPCRGDVDDSGVVSASDAQALWSRFQAAAKEGMDAYDLLLDPDGNGVISASDAQLAFGEFSAAKNCKNTGPNTGSGRSFYNGDGLRVRSRTFPGGAPTDHDYAWDVGGGLPQILQDTNVQAGTTTTFVYGLGLISTTDGGGATSYYLPDGLGSTSQLTDSAGAITDRYAYDVFGAMRSQSGTTANDFRFTGQQDDFNVNRGLYYLRARSYDPALGRFLQRDPLPFVQRYSYAGGNPANLVDPSGMFPCPGCGRIKRAVADAAGAISTSADALATGYIELGGTGCYWLCTTAGIQFGWRQGFHVYAGPGIGTPGGGINVNLYPGQSISKGWTCETAGGVSVYPEPAAGVGFGAAGGVSGVAVGFKESRPTFSGGKGFGGGGLYLGVSGGSVSCSYVSPNLLDLF